MFIKKSKIEEFECQISDLNGRCKKLEDIVEGHKELYDETKKMFEFLSGGAYKKKKEEKDSKSKLVRLNKFI